MMTFEDWKKIQSSFENAEMDCDTFLLNLFSSKTRTVEIDGSFARWLATESSYVIDCCAEVDEESLYLYADYILSIGGRTFMVRAECGFGNEEFYDQTVEEVRKTVHTQTITTWETIWA